MVPSEKYFETHPEYFALFKGRRVPMGSPGRPSYADGNLCTTIPDVIRLASEFIIQWFDDNAAVPLNPNDGAVKWCECDNCRALGGVNFMSGPEGSMSKRLVTFTNAVARNVARKHPDRKIIHLAYSNYVDPVPSMPLEKNVVLQYALHGCYAHAPDKCPANAKVADQMRAWAKLAPGGFGVWEYFLLGDHRTQKTTPAILPLALRAADTVRFIRELGGSYYFTQSSYKYWRHNPLVFYMLARMVWTPDADPLALIRDFCDAMYGPAGPAGPAMRDYYLTIERAAQQSDWHPQTYAEVAAPSPKVFTPELLEKAERLLKQAEALPVILNEVKNL